MRRLASLVRWFFGPRMRHPIDDDPSLPFTPEEFGRLIRSGRREDMKLLAEGLACRSVPRRIKYPGDALGVPVTSLARRWFPRALSVRVRPP